MKPTPWPLTRANCSTFICNAGDPFSHGSNVEIPLFDLFPVYLIKKVAARCRSLLLVSLAASS